MPFTNTTLKSALNMFDFHIIMIYSSSDKGREVCVFVGRLEFFHKLAIFFTKFHEVLFIMSFPRSFCLSLYLLPDFLSVVALFNESIEVLRILLPVFVIFIRVVGLEVNCQKFKSTLL